MSDSTPPASTTLYDPTTDPNPQPRTYHGSCHCGFIKYTICNLLICPATVTRCNCTHCHKSNYTFVKLLLSNLSLQSPASLQDIPFYQFGEKTVKSYFCPKCAVKPFAVRYLSKETPDVLGVGINLVTLDDLDLSKFVCKQYWNARLENQEEWKIGEGPWEGGAI